MTKQRWLLAPLAVLLCCGFLAAQPPGRGDPRKGDPKKGGTDVERARAEVRKLSDEVSKLEGQLRDAQRQLTRAQQQLDNLTGPGERGRMPPFADRGRMPPFAGGPWGWGRGMDRPAPAPAATERTADLEKRLDRILQDIETLRREIRRDAPRR